MGGITMNEFEKSVQCQRNDAVDAGVGFFVSFGFFATIFIIGTVIKLIGS
jgi:YqzM-like protein